MFTRQAPPLLNQLWLGGMSPAAAHAVQNLLGQCRAPLWHNGPVRFDHTRESMRLIEPDSGKFEFPGAQLPPPQKFPPEEEESPLEPGGFLPDEHMPFEPPVEAGPGEGPRMPLQPKLPVNNYWAGKYISLDDFNTFSLSCDDKRRHAVFPAKIGLAGFVGSVEFQGRSQSPYASLQIAERQAETEFTIDLHDLTEVEFISDVDLSDPTKIVFTVDKAHVFHHNAAHRTIEITLSDCPGTSS
jgi:hypothetical protein